MSEYLETNAHLRAELFEAKQQLATAKGLLVEGRYVELYEETERLRKELANREKQIAEWLDRNLYSAREYAEKLRNGEKWE